MSQAQSAPTGYSQTVRLLSLASLITPAKLTIQPDMVTRVTMQQVPKIDFDNSTKFGIILVVTENNTKENISYRMSEIKLIIVRVSATTAVTAMIQPMLGPYPNSSYEQQFYGPALKCRPANQSETDIITDLWPLVATNPGNDCLCFGAQPGRTLNRSIIAFTSGFNLEGRLSNQFYFSTGNRMASSGFETGFLSKSPQNFTCDLYNASYGVHFEFSNGQQSTRLVEFSFVDVVPYDDYTHCYEDPKVTAQSQVSYHAIMVGLVGQLAGYASNTVTTTNIVQSGLAAANNFYLINISNLNSEDPKSLMSDDLPSTSQNLAALIEEYFRNLTLSLLSKEQLL